MDISSFQLASNSDLQEREGGTEGAGATHELSLILVVGGTISWSVTLAIVTYNVT